MFGAYVELHVRCLFKRVEILHIPCQYLFLLVDFIVNNEEIFQTN